MLFRSLGEIAALSQELEQRMSRRIRDSRVRAGQQELRLKALSPGSRIRERKMTALRMEERLQDRMERLLQSRRHRLEVCIQQLKGLSPLEKLSSGYAYVTDESGKNIRLVEQAREGQRVRIRVTDGTFDAVVERRAGDVEEGEADGKEV